MILYAAPYSCANAMRVVCKRSARTHAIVTKCAKRDDERRFNLHGVLRVLALRAGYAATAIRQDCGFRATWWRFRRWWPDGALK